MLTCFRTITLMEKNLKLRKSGKKKGNNIGEEKASLQEQVYDMWC